MLSKLRSFSKTKLAGVLIAIIIIPFVFWGMGSVFSGGNTNNVAKINNETISTKEFVELVNSSNLNIDVIKKNIDNNILEQILAELISNKLLDMEVTNLNIDISELSLVKKIKNNDQFLDNNNNFSRLKYEKFLLKNNFTAPGFENNFKKEELKKILFNYVGGGIKSPYFLNNKFYIKETKKVEIDYFDLKHAYVTDVTNTEIEKFIIDNKENLKEDFIDLSYAKITPQDLVEINEFNDEFFKKIDDIENSILNGSKINEVAENHNLKLVSKTKYKLDTNADEIVKEIYAKRNEEKINLIDKNDYFLLYEIKKVDKVLPNKKDQQFIDKVKKNLILKNKLNLHQEIYKKIQNKKFNDNDFLEIAKMQDNIKNITLDNISDYKKFDESSVKLIYELPKKSFILVTDQENKIYLAKIKNVYFNELNKDKEKSTNYLNKSNANIINNIYGSYDLSLNSKYKVKIFHSTLDRVKNFFR